MNNNENEPNIVPLTEPVVEIPTEPSTSPVSTNTTTALPIVDPLASTNSLPIVNPMEVNKSTEPVIARDPFASAPSTKPPIVIPPATSPAVFEKKVDGGEGAVVNENLKKVEVEYTPPSKGKTILLILFFIGLLGFVIFLPEITTFINKYKAGAYKKEESKITTGKLVCSLKSGTEEIDKNYDVNFQFADNKLERFDFSVTTRGDISLDEATLDELNNTCMQLEENVENLTGVIVRCNYSSGKLVEKHSFELANIDVEALDSAYAEAGGNRPEFVFGQDMDIVEKNMNASGYTCAREK